MKFFKLLVVVLLIPPFTYSCILVASSLKRFDWGTVPDWFSFFANACTVFVTLIIAKRAKKFLDEKVHSEGLTRGYKILDAIDEINDSLPSLLSWTLSNDKVIKIALKPEENYSNYSLSSAIESAGKLNFKIKETNIRLRKINNMLRRLKRWHIENMHPVEFDNFISSCTTFLDKLECVTGYNSELDYPDTEYSYSKASEILPILTASYYELDEVYQKILELKFKETFKES